MARLNWLGGSFELRLLGYEMSASRAAISHFLDGTEAVTWEKPSFEWLEVEVRVRRGTAAGKAQDHCLTVDDVFALCRWLCRACAQERDELEPFEPTEPAMAFQKVSQDPLVLRVSLSMNMHLNRPRKLVHDIRDLCMFHCAPDADDVLKFAVALATELIDLEEGRMSERAAGARAYRERHDPPASTD